MADPAANAVSGAPREGMQFVRGGAFVMGSEDFYPEEALCRRIEVGDFWIDETPVTNGAFESAVRFP